MILNRQRTVRIARPALESFLRRIRHHLRLGKAEVTIAFVTDAEIARLNRAYRKKKGPTDVLSFPAIAHRTPISLPAAPPFLAVQATATIPAQTYLGDIAISPATARRNARKFGHTFPDELRILMLHGVLHLLGYDHETDDGQMDRLEQTLRQELGLA
jgi:probable rRNA maturation factor